MPRHRPQVKSLRVGRVRATALTIAALCALTAAGSSAAAATTLFVDRSSPSCSDAGAGTPTQPFCTIGAAASKATAGQTVQVAAGIYPEKVTVPTSGTSTAPITFTAAPGANVTLSGGTNGFVISGRSWITVNGFTVTRTSGYGIDVSNASHITLSGNDISFAGQRVSGSTKGGIKFSAVTDSVVANNRVHDNSDYGIYLTSSSMRNEVRDNTVYANAEGYQRAAAGIRLYSSPGNTVHGNISHDNEDSGIESYTGSNNTLLYDNVTYDNGDHGIDNYNSTGQTIVANTVYGNVTAGINVEANSTGATLANNISVENGIASPRTHSNIRIESGSTSGTTMDYDLVNLSAADTMLIWNSVSYSSLSSFQAATGQEAHGIQADPRFNSVSAGDFRLAAGSPAIDSANSGASGQPAADVEGHPRFDDPATPNTGAGPRAYDDRGAYEFGQGESPPSAVLVVNPSSGPPPLAVTADASGSTDVDSTPIASYSFDFGDGSPASGPQAASTASHTYGSPGVYTVTVTVTDTGGLASSATAQVTVADAPPTAALMVSPSSGMAPLEVSADASGSTDADGTPIAAYTFDWGDGTSTTPVPMAATASHSYTQPGTYTVKVTVTDTAGNASTATATVQVTADAPPVAAITVTPLNGPAPLTVTADASASTDADRTPIAKYTFAWGDGTPDTTPAGATAQHTYTKKGTYMITVTVTDTAGLTSQAKSKPVKVR